MFIFIMLALPSIIQIEEGAYVYIASTVNYY